MKLEKSYIYSTVNQNKDKGKILYKISAFEGSVIEEKGSEDKIQYETDESKFMVDWFSLTNTTSKTKFEDNSRQKRGNYQSRSLKKSTERNWIEFLVSQDIF